LLILQVSDGGGGKKTWDVRCVVIGILVLLIIVAGAVAAVIAHRFKGQLRALSFVKLFVLIITSRYIILVV
jgi:hypothetical protein